MTDERYLESIKTMTVVELLTEVMTNPDYLTDSYYRKFGIAIRARYQELLGGK